MSVLEWVRFLVGGGLLLCGLGTFIIEIIGVFRFRYVLNRMHAAIPWASALRCWG